MNTVRTTLVLALAVTLSISTGCKTTSWTMPGKSLFSWNKKPDDTMVASNTEMPQYPNGPAAKYDPATIQSVGAQTQGSGTRSGSAYGYAQTVSTPKTNLAAQANGYTYPQTGSYQTGTTATGGQAASAGLPSPYGSGYTDTTATAGTTTAAEAVTPTSYPALPTGTAGTASYGTTGTNPISQYPALPTGSAGAATAPATGGYQGSTTLPSNAAGYAPGTTSRSTNYNFGTQGSTGTGSNTFSLPANTASGPGATYR